MKLVAPTFVAAGIAFVAISFGASASAAGYSAEAPRYQGWAGDTEQVVKGAPVAYRATQHYYASGKHVAYGFVELTKSEARRFPSTDPFILSSSEFARKKDASRLVFNARTGKAAPRTVKSTPALRSGAKTVEVRSTTDAAITPVVTTTETTATTVETVPASIEATVPAAPTTTIAAPVPAEVEATH